MYTATDSYNLVNETVCEMSDYDLEKKKKIQIISHFEI